MRVAFGKQFVSMQEVQQTASICDGLHQWTFLQYGPFCEQSCRYFGSELVASAGRSGWGCRVVWQQRNLLRTELSWGDGNFGGLGLQPRLGRTGRILRPQSYLNVGASQDYFARVHSRENCGSSDVRCEQCGSSDRK